VDIKDSLHEEEKKIKERNGYNFREKAYFNKGGFKKKGNFKHSHKTTKWHIQKVL